MGPTTISELEGILKQDIITYLSEFKNQNILEESYSAIFSKLDEKFTGKFDIKPGNINWNDVYKNYKRELAEKTGTNYSSKNDKINELYNFVDSDENVQINDIYNINKVDNNIKAVLEIFNVLIIIDNFSVNYNSFTNDELYEKLLGYLWSFEYLTTLTYFNSGQSKYEFLLTQNEKNNFLNDYHQALKLSLFFRDKDIINVICYLNIIYRQNNPSDTQLNIIRNKLLDLSSNYLSFMEIKLFANFINDVKDYKQDRTGFDIQNDYWFPKVSYLFNDIIMKHIWKVDFTYKNIYRIQRKIYLFIYDLLDNECNFLLLPKVKNFWGCGGAEMQHAGASIFGFTIAESPASVNQEIYNSEITTEGFTQKSKKYKNVIEKMGGGYAAAAAIGTLIALIAGLLDWALKPMINYLMDQVSEIPIVREALTLVKFFVLVVTALGQIGVDGMLFLLLGFVIYFVATIIKVILFTFDDVRRFSNSLDDYAEMIEEEKNNNKDDRQPLGFAVILIGLLVVPFILILIFIKSSIILLIIAVISFICIVIIVIDNVIEKTTRKPKNDMYPMTHINVASKFIYRNFLSCENSPHSWYKNSRYDLENKSSRGFFCNKPCKSNYRLSDDKSFCEKAPTNVPYYCPQPLLFRHFRKEKLYGKNFIQEFIPQSHPILLLNSNAAQREYINNFNKNKKEYYNTCQDINSPYYKNYNVIGKNICAYGFAKNHNKVGDEDENIKDDINLICKQTYCENGNYENFCYKYEEDAFKPEEIIKDNNKFTKYLKILILGIILYSLCIYLVNSFNSIINNKKVDNPFTWIGNRYHNSYIRSGIRSRISGLGRRFRDFRGQGRTRVPFTEGEYLV